MEILIFILSLFQGIFGAKQLILFSKRMIYNPYCEDPYVLSCNSVYIMSADILGDPSIDLPGSINVKLSNMIPGSTKGYHYMSDEAEAVLTFNDETGGMFGHITTAEGKVFVLEHCGEFGHVYKELDLNTLGDDLAVDETEGISEDGITGGDVKDKTENYFDVETSVSDEVVTFTAKIYYTPKFAAITPDLEGFIDQVIADTNQGYINSKVNLRIEKHCPEEATINDGNSIFDTLRAFKQMKGGVVDLRGSADVAVLLVSKAISQACGIAYLNSISSGSVVSVVAKPCALGYYSFGHEIGHNVGLHHNKEVATNRAVPYGHGHLIAKGTQETGLRTILAYRANNHKTRVNYYSNPLINHPTTGEPTGVAGVSDNALLLNQRANILVNMGDESKTCSIETTTTTTTETMPKYCGVTGTIPSMKIFKKKRGVKDSISCQSVCSSDSLCKYWNFKFHKVSRKCLCSMHTFSMIKKKGSIFVSGPVRC